MALIVEDGTGLSTAESYISVTDADTYISNHYGAEASWSAATEAVKEQALRQASAYLDSRYNFVGIRQIFEQALEWPRYGAVRNDDATANFDIRDSGPYGSQYITGVPQRVKDATVEMALKVVQGETIFPDVSQEGLAESVKVGPIETKYRSGSSSTLPHYQIATRLLRFLIVNSTYILRG